MLSFACASMRELGGKNTSLAEAVAAYACKLGPFGVETSIIEPATCGSLLPKDGTYSFTYVTRWNAAPVSDDVCPRLI